MRDVVRRRRAVGDRRHLDDFDIAFRRAVEIRARAVRGQQPVAERHAGRRDRRRRAGLVGGLEQRAAAGRGRERRGPYVERRQEQVEVEDFAAVLAFEEADLHRFHRRRRVDHGQQRVVRVAGRIATHCVVRIDQHLTQPIRVQVDRLRGAGRAQRADTSERGAQRLLLENIHGW